MREVERQDSNSRVLSFPLALRPQKEEEEKQEEEQEEEQREDGGVRRDLRE